MKMNTKGWVSLLLLGSMVPANATIARLQALGMDETDNEGSYYIEDNRNIFLNAGNIHKYADSLVMEWGDEGNNVPAAGTASQLATDEITNPKAKGGFLKSHGDWTYGLYLGNESNTSALLRALATGAAAAAQTGATSGATNNMLDGSDNQLDIFFGKKSSMFDWGVNLVYTKDDNDTGSQEDHGYAARLGLIGDRWDGFLNLSLASNSKRTDTLGTVGTVTAGTQINHEFDGKLGIHLGGGYEIQKGMKVYAMAKKFDWDQKDSVGSYGSTQGQQGTVEGGFLTYAVGLGRVHEFGDSKLFTNIEYRSTSIEVKFNNRAEAENVEVPLTFGYEVKATEWLTLRGSVRQHLYGYRKNNNYSSLNVIGSNFANQVFGADTNNKKVTFDNTTDVNAGMSLPFGRLVIDGLVGFSGNDGVSDGDEAGVFAADRLLTRVGATYSF
ncbi:MAG: hypothetical protein CME63_15070 [Halobacteriovoraceae bacterium]|nr:hypothetical protein [Halobacteriovoraceae bacterium]